MPLDSYVTLEAEDLESLDQVSAPRLSFPTQFLINAVQAAYSGVTVNGQSFAKHKLV